MSKRVLTGWRRRFLCFGAAIVLLSVLLTGCGTTEHVGEPGLPQEEGLASYYAGKYAGKPTANGEIFNPEALTAAHRTLPFGTKVRVIRTDTPDEPSVVVRINDRGPFKRGRIIDLTKAAAQRLEMIEEGIVEIRLEILSYPEGVEEDSSDTTGEPITW